MAKTKVAVTLDAKLVGRLDSLVRQAQFPNRSQAVEAALVEKLARLDRTRLARECAKLDPEAERALAEESMGKELASWPDY
ncbi:MAG: ribbon-helix-helix protein, CopG family [Gemmatimonadetes bacterium]|nr:ribbon-helix-helix protein, CopG family [Gemmatimonadota bacterium]